MRGRPKNRTQEDAMWNSMMDTIIESWCHVLNDDDCYYHDDCPFAEVCKKDIEGHYKQEASYRFALSKVYDKVFV